MPTWEEDREAEPGLRRSLVVRGPSGDPGPNPGSSHRQQRQMMAALAILAIALLLVVVKDWQFWFPAGSTTAEQNATPADETETDAQTAASAPGSVAARPKPPKSLAVPAAAQGADTSTTNSSGPSITATQRTVLPPLEVEVVAGGEHRTVQAHNNSVKVDMQSESAPPAKDAVVAAAQTAQQSAPAVAPDVSATVRLSPETAQVLSRPVEPSYPLLAKQMKVQGAVVLEALIGKEGSIENLRVLSGPAILSSAAMEAVKQWRFKPYFQNGRPVETQARITVNFTISTS